jgi:hypothetical protein
MYSVNIVITLEKPQESAVQTATVVDKIEAFIDKNMTKVEFPLKHVFTKGLYSRIMFIPAGGILVGRIHKFEHQFVVSQGEICVIDELTGSREFIKAPYHGTTEAGARRAGFAITDTIWATFHVTNLTDPEEIVEKFTDYPLNPLINKLQ